MASKEAPVAEEMDSQSQLAAHQVSFRRETETELQGADEEVAPDESEGGGEGDVQKQPKRQKVSQMQDVPLVVPQAVCKDKKASLLVQLKEGDLDFSGDTGAIGRITVPSKGKAGLAFDLKGQQFDGQIMRSATMLVVGVGPTEAKVEGLFSEFCDLYYKGDVFEAMGGDVLKGDGFLPGQALLCCCPACIPISTVFSTVSPKRGNCLTRCDGEEGVCTPEKGTPPHPFFPLSNRFLLP
ncbi:unnamed protein product, partial [Discosporangium mesarthrocarpum]